MNYRTAQANWTPTDWSAFCKQALTDANKGYRRQLLSEATDDDLAAMYGDLLRRRESKDRERDDIEDQLRDIDREFALRRKT